MTESRLKATTQGEMMRFKHVLTQDMIFPANKPKLVRTKYLFIPKRHKTSYNGNIMPFIDQLMIRLSAQYHPNISNLMLRVAHHGQGGIKFDTENLYEFKSMKALRAFVKKTKKKIQSYKYLASLSLWAKHDLFREASRAGVGRRKRK